jgi:Cu+-exporting ATPase
METAKIEKVLDVVCGMRIDPSAARETKMYKEKSYSFCSHLCAVKFEREPERYLTVR